MTSYNFHLWDNDGIFSSNFQNIYKSSIYCLFNSTIVLPNGNINIDLSKIKDYDKSHYEIEKINNNNINNYYHKQSKTNFINDSFYNLIVQTEEKQNNFKNIHTNTNFTMLDRIDKSNSSVFFYYQKITELKKNGQIEKIEQTINTQLNSLYKYKKEDLSIISNLYICQDLNNDFKYYRKVKADGNSFYISFMYQYFKNLIINNNQIKISDIFNIDRQVNNKMKTIFINNDTSDIKKKPTLGRNYISDDNNDKDVDNIVQAFALLSLIYLKTVDNDFDRALEILDYSFSYEKTFVNILCFYMRIQIKKFIINNKDIFTYENYCEQYKLISKEYYDSNNKTFLYEKYINENVIIDQLEPSLFIISLVPYIFNINLNLYINEHSSYKEINEPLCNKISINQTIKTIINILYTSFSYHIIEMEANKNSEIITQDLSNIFNLTSIDNSKEKENYIIDIDKNYNEKCNICSCTKFIKLKNISKNEFCLNCFKKTINEIFKQRYKYMKKEQFKFIEYYLREIPLTNSNNINNSIYLTSSEFYFIFKDNIFTYFRKIIENICDICDNIYLNKIVNKKCKCKRCINCAKNEINDNIVLNVFEKKYIYNKNIIKCECGEKINQIEYMSQIVNILSGEEKEEYEKEAQKRLFNYIKDYCMNCGKKIVYDKEKDNYYKYNIENNNLEHFICKKCHDDNNLNNNNYFCIICQENHNIKENDSNINEKKEHKDDGKKNNISLSKSERVNYKGVNYFNQIILEDQKVSSKEEMTNYEVKRENSNKELNILPKNEQLINKKKNKCSFKFILNKILNICPKSNS